jgi:hypothetical protein
MGSRAGDLPEGGSSPAPRPAEANGHLLVSPALCPRRVQRPGFLSCDGRAASIGMGGRFRSESPADFVGIRPASSAKVLRFARQPCLDLHPASKHPAASSDGGVVRSENLVLFTAGPEGCRQSHIARKASASAIQAPP